MTGDRNIAFSLWGDISRRQRRSQPCVSYEGCPTRACIWLQRMCFVLLCRLIGAGVVWRGIPVRKRTTVCIYGIQPYYWVTGGPHQIASIFSSCQGSSQQAQFSFSHSEHSDNTPFSASPLFHLISFGFASTESSIMASTTRSRLDYLYIAFFGISLASMLCKFLRFPIFA